MPHPNTTPWPPGDGEMATLIRAHDWATTPLGPIATWPQSRRTAVDLLLASGFPAALTLTPEAITLYNDGYRAIIGDRHPRSLGVSTFANFPELRPQYEPILARVWQGETVTLADAPYSLVRHAGGAPEEAWFTLTFCPLRDEAGRVVGVYSVMIETTAQLRAERRRDAADADLRASEARLRLATEAAEMYTWDHDLRSKTTVFSANTARIIGAPPPRSPEEITHYTHPDDRRRVAETGRRAIEDGLDHYEYEFRSIAAPGEVRQFRVWCAITRDAAGEPIRSVGITQDITERKRAEERQAFLLKLSDALRPLADPVEVQIEASHLLGEYLRASRVLYIEVQSDGDTCVIHRDYTNGIPSVAGRHALSSYEAQAREKWLMGQTVVYADVEGDESLSADQRAAIAAAQVRAWMGMPLLKSGRLVAILSVHQSVPRSWSGEEIELVKETAERTWAAVERARAGAALRASETRLQLALDATAMGTFIWRVDEVRAESDERLLALFGLPADTTITLHEALTMLLHPDDQGRYAASIAQAIDPHGTGELREDIRVLLPDGSLRWLSITAQTSFTGTPRRADQMAGVGLDITERKEAEAELRESEERFRGFAEHSVDTLWIIDAATRQLDYLSPAFERMWGASRVAVMADLGRWAALVHPDDWAAAATALPGALAGETRIAEYRIIRPSDGAVRWIRDTGFPVRDDGGNVVRAAGIAQDITDHMRTEAALRETLATLEARVAERTTELRALSRQLLAVREVEQRHLSRELHDQIGQLLTGLRLVLGTRQPDTGSLGRARALVDDIQARVRALSLDLRPPALDHLGLLPALHDHLRRYTEQTGVRADLRHAGLDRRLPPEVETAAFRIAQEALTNVARHAGIDVATVQLVADDGWLTVQVRDAGRGFDPDDALAARVSAGLAGMRERVALLDGTLTIDAAPGAGTVVTAELPLNGAGTPIADEGE